MERRPRDHAQRIRLGVQLAFVALNAWICVQFFLWVRWIETGQRAVARPAGVEGWLPIAGLMNLKAWIATGAAPRIHPAAAVLFGAFVLMSILLKKAFCSWLCPIGTLSEWVWKAGRSRIVLPRWLDVPLRGVKYLLLAFFVWFIARMPAEGIAEFMRAPYGVTADIRMLNFFRFLSTTAVIVIVSLLVLSLVIRNFWCRYLCPYGALLGLVSVISPLRIRRDASKCIDCAKCAKACPSRLPVDVKPRIRSAECTMCMSCVAACPVKGALDAKITRRRTMPAWAVAAALLAIFTGAVAWAKVTGHWQTPVADDVIRYFVLNLT